MDVRLIDLPWLPAPSEDFRQQVRNLSESASDSYTFARRLAEYRLNQNQLHLLGKVVTKLAADKADVVRLGVLSNSTADLLLPAFTVSALRHGVLVQVIGTAFDQVALEALNPESEINQARCHFVLLSIDHRGLPLTPTPGDADRARATVEAAL